MQCNYIYVFNVVVHIRLLFAEINKYTIVIIIEQRYIFYHNDFNISSGKVVHKFCYQTVV